VTTVINLYGGPGTGKSTSAAYLYYLLKQGGRNVEMVREYVKDWAWEGRKIGDFDQLYFLGKQSRKESMLFDKVDFIVTDSPIAMSSFYAKLYNPEVIAKPITMAVRAYYDLSIAKKHRHWHVFLARSKVYNPSGRFQTEAQAKVMDVQLKTELQSLGMDITDCDTDEQALKQLYQHIIFDHDLDRR
jgi:hypothetical protein